MTTRPTRIRLAGNGTSDTCLSVPGLIHQVLRVWRRHAQNTVKVVEHVVMFDEILASE